MSMRHLRTLIVSLSAEQLDRLGRITAYLGDRQRRILQGALQGRTQRQIAADEGITQPAVSQALQAVVRAVTAFIDDERKFNARKYGESP